MKAKNNKQNQVNKEKWNTRRKENLILIQLSLNLYLVFRQV